MYLDEARPAGHSGGNLAITELAEAAVSHRSPAVFEKWRNWPASAIEHHGGACCGVALEWLGTIDFTELGGSSIRTGPRWLRTRHKWGPSSYPIYWCEAVRRKTLDCGALAAMAYEIFKTRGVSVLHAQMVQRFSPEATLQWQHGWNDEGDSPLPWTDGELIYHEGCAIETAEGLKVWDPSAGWWIDPVNNRGYGSTVALRVTSPKPVDKRHKWGPHVLVTGEWASF